MSKWQEKYELVGIQPGKVVLRGGKIIDFSDPNLKIETVDEAFKLGTRYLKLKSPKSMKNNEKPNPAE